VIAISDFGPVFDTDLHHDVAEPGVLMPYLSSGWQQYVRDPEPQPWQRLFPGFPNSNPHGFYREDAIPPDGGTPGSSLELIRSQLLDPNGVEQAILTHGDGLYLDGLTNPYFALEIARALNDWTRSEWLDRDRRLRGTILLSCQVPDQAAAEVRRVAEDSRFVEVLVCANPIGHGFGHPVFEPIHRACAETGLPLAIHSLGEGAAGSAASALAGGRPTTYFEYHSGGLEGMQTHLMSFITHGVFERYRSLKVVLTEAGVAWIPAFLRRMDSNWKGLRREIPWVKRAPSEVFHEHVRVTTQPLDLETSDDPLLEPLVAYGFEEVLMFSSDYPHWDADDVGTAVARLPRSWRERVLWGNASELYGVDVPVPT
jgi:hypothetical protein